MKRLTDRKTAADLKRNCEGLRAKGIDANISDLRYIKLAEYENADENFEIFRKTHTVTLYECDAENNIECNKTACYLYGGECRHTLEKRFAKGSKPAKTNWDELASYALDKDLQEETKWTKENPALTPFIKQRFMKRR